MGPALAVIFGDPDQFHVGGEKLDEKLTYWCWKKSFEVGVAICCYQRRIFILQINCTHVQFAGLFSSS